MSDLLDAYSGSNAAKYEDVRSGSPRWQREVEVMEALLGEHGAVSIVDCPFGTGRWIPQYQAVGATVFGIDLSEGMLEQARVKLKSEAASAAENFQLIKGNIFDLGQIAIPSAPDLMVCVRFINWVSFGDAFKVIESMSSLQAKHLILGASVVPEGVTGLRRAWMGLALRIINLRNLRRPKQFVHDESELLALLGRFGWRLVEKHLIFRSRSRANYFFSFVRG